MRRILFGIAIGVGLVLGMFLGSIIVSAQTAIPEGVQVFTIPSGQTCVLWPDGSGDCYCPCEGGQCAQTNFVPASPTDVVPTPDVEKTPAPTPTPQATPTVGPTLGPTLEPTPQVTPEPTREKCNKGGGNGSEDCDPGNHPENGNDDEN